MTTAIMPIAPRWPEVTNMDLPIVQPLPIIDPIFDSYWARMRKFFSKRPEYVVKEEYFTYIHCIGAWMYCPPNFVFDFASVPKIIPLINPAGVFAYPALPHDFIYRFGGLLISYNIAERYRFVPFTRKEGDEIFLDQAKRANKLGFLDNVSTGILRAVGGSNYKPRDINSVDWSREVRASK